jgi:uncharacterized protein (DUF2147 family)
MLKQFYGGKNMKQVVCIGVFILGMAGVVHAADPDPCEGFWISIDDKTGKATAGWEIYVVNGKLFGKILSIAGFSQDILAEKCKENYRDFPVAGNVRMMKIVGTPWIYGLSAEERGIWSGGSIVDPNTGSLYKCKITYHAKHPTDKSRGETLEMRGEIGLGVGRSQFWQKTSRENASSLK